MIVNSDLVLCKYLYCLQIVLVGFGSPELGFLLSIYFALEQSLDNAVHEEEAQGKTTLMSKKWPLFWSFALKFP